MASSLSSRVASLRPRPLSSGISGRFAPEWRADLNGIRTVPAGKAQAPRLIDKKALNAMRFLADVPLVTLRFSDNNTVLECLHGEIAPFEQCKGICQDNYGNKYHLIFRP